MYLSDANYESLQCKAWFETSSVEPDVEQMFVRSVTHKVLLDAWDVI